jgi:hypothetical protein
MQILVAIVALVIAGNLTYGVLTADPTGTPEQAASLLHANRARLDDIIRALQSEPTLVDQGVEPLEPIEERGGVIGAPIAAHTRRAYDEIAATMKAMQLRGLVATRDGDGLRSVEFEIFGDGYFGTATRVGALWLAPSKPTARAEWPGCHPSGTDRWLICPGSAGDYAQQTGLYSD